MYKVYPIICLLYFKLKMTKMRNLLDETNLYVLGIDYNE